MKRIVLGGLLIAGIPAIFFHPIRAQAQEVDSSKKNWDIGVDLGMIYPTKAHQFNNSLDNAIVYDLLVRETIGDEIAEGFAPPPMPGWSNVSSSIKPIYELAAHAHYMYDEHLWFGLEGGWGFRRGTFIDDQGIYSRLFLKIRDESSIIHAAPVVKLVQRFGSFRPSLTFGPEWSMFHQLTIVSFTDPDDSIVPSVVVDKNTSFGGVLAGIGLEWIVSETGSLQASAAYHKVFAPNNKFDYVTPQLRFIVRL